METKLIVKYRRQNDCWVCPDCDAENDIGSNRCTVCSYAKNPTVNILKAWNPALERVSSTSAAKKATSDSSRTSMWGGTSSDSGSHGTEENNSNIFWIVAGIVALFFILLVLT